MTPLTQQLEDKKKELIDTIEKSNPRKYKWLSVEHYKRIPIIKAEIAILEQAIAEIKVLEMNNEIFRASFKNASKVITKLEEDMQKQRQNFIDIINSLGEIRGKSNDLQCIKLGESFSTNSVEWLKKELLKQLNQPKTEE